MIYYKRLIFKVYDELIPISPDSIVCCKADDDWSVISLTGNKEVQINEPVSVIIKKLPYQHFLRVHKDWIVNVLYIDKVFWEINHIRMIDGVEIELLPMMKFRLERLLLQNPIFCRELEWME